MKQSDLAILLREGEGSMLEYKESLSSSFARELVAMANSTGGKMLLGVRDDGTVKGFEDSNALRARIQDIARNCDPPVKVLVKRVGKITVVTVRESDAKPVQYSDGFFWRQGAVTQKLSRAEIRDFFRSEGAIRFDLMPCPRFRFYPNPEVRAMATAPAGPSRDQVGSKSQQETAHVPHMCRTSPGQVALLRAAREAKSREKLQQVAAIRHRQHFLSEYLRPLLDAGLLERTIPDKPRSSKQRYRLTRTGREYLERIHHRDTEDTESR